MKQLIIDGQNFAWRSKVWEAQSNSVIYVFFRNLRSLIDIHQPDRVWYVLEGYPKIRHELAPEYKANRKLAADDPKLEERRSFNDDIRTARLFMINNFPVTTVRHSDWECDDTIFNVAKDLDISDDIIISSSDNDFLQLIQALPHVKLWNHTKKTFSVAPDYDYVTWKALRGDGSDNIKGIKGVGDKTAVSLVNDQDSLIEFLAASDHRRNTFEKNLKLIRFHEFDDHERSEIEIARGSLNVEAIKEMFSSISADSMLADPYWTRFVDTFRRIDNLS